MDSRDGSNGYSVSSGGITRTDIPFVDLGKHQLVGDLYMPAGAGRPPLLVAVHGGGWQAGSRKIYEKLGPYLANEGYAVFAIEYRLSTWEEPSYPGAVCDVKAAIRYVRANADELGVNPDRIGLIGDSAGAHLSALAALAGEKPVFADAPFAEATVSTDVRAVIGVYGVYDIYAQWQRDLVKRPNDSICEKHLGYAPYNNREIFFEASPISYTTVRNNKTPFLLIYGTHDDVVDSGEQSGAFLLALKQAGFYVRSAVVNGAGHFFISDPVDASSFNGSVGPGILRFLEEIGF